MRNKKRHGFTLIELVVAIMIIGIMAAIAVPKMLNTSKTAADAAVKQNLSVIRSAIDMFSSANNGALPGQAGTSAGFQTDLAPYLRVGTVFPMVGVGPAKTSNALTVTTAGVALSGSTTPTTGWAYDNVSGQLIINYHGLSVDGVTYYDAW